MVRFQVVQLCLKSQVELLALMVHGVNWRQWVERERNAGLKEKDPYLEPTAEVK